MLSFANYADPVGENCRPSIARVCGETGLAESTVKLAIKHLVEVGLLRVIKASTGRGNCNVYAMPVSLHAMADAYDKIKGSNDESDETEKGPIETEKGPIDPPKGADSRLLTLEPIYEPNIPRKPNDDFETWWQVYPQRIGSGGNKTKGSKPLARRQFEKARRKTSLQILMLAAGQYAKLQDPHFVKDASGWLSNEMWNDWANRGGGDKYDKRYFRPNSAASVAALPRPKTGTKEFESWNWARAGDFPGPSSYPENDQ